MYAAEPQVLDDLRALNFVFGTNGSGKTTISRVIADPGGSGECKLVWEGGRELERLVYNTDFVDKNFASPMPGIFTLGETEVETLNTIKQTKVAIDKLEDDLSGLRASLGPLDGSSGKRAELKNLRANFEGCCWLIKQNHDARFKDAFTGLRSSKANFCDRILSELDANTAALTTLDDLTQRATTIFGAGLQRLQPLGVIDLKPILGLQTSPALTKIVVGKEDVDVAALIKRLGNSDWVRQGLTYSQDAGDQCPFCQQEVDAQRIADLSAYFDETYIAELAAIDQLTADYERHANDIVRQLEANLATGSSKLDAAALGEEIDRLKSVIRANLTELARKKREPSSTATLESVFTIGNEAADLISSANDAIAAHNGLVDNAEVETTKLVGEIWRYLLSESDADIQAYCRSRSDLDKGVVGLSAAIEGKNAQLKGEQATLAEHERRITSVQPTVTATNAILSSFGFTSFKLTPTGEHNHLYALVRGDGTDASKTLSEGERSFVAFLYFYHLIRGSVSATGVTADRVIVFDDPVSSLDSDVLFVVSSLIRSVSAEAETGNTTVKQVFVLTHNIYFHKQVSFDVKRGAQRRAHETFWIVRKRQDKSVVQEFDYNPIKTSYELLWAEVKREDHSGVSIQNTLRRIIEHYFTILGNLDRDTIIEKFSGRDKQVCAALFSWINDGSHSSHDEIFVSADEALTERYVAVFKRVFEETGQLPHYQMMMGETVGATGEESKSDSEEAQLSEASRVPSS
jgi:wobble nucleotide-excising tRNase